jgi:multidrug efflux pump subunit AcrA (membrane-fusion protein)
VPELAVVERGELALTVEVSGAVQSVDAVRVGPPSIPELWNYQIQMMAPEGEVVEKGTPVLAFDTSELQRRLDTWTADRDSAATQLELQRAAGKVARQDEALAIAEAQADLELVGRVRNLGHGVQRASPETPLKVVMVDIELQPNEAAKLRPGMRFRGRIETGRVEDVLLVPLDAIFPTDDGPVAYRERGGVLERVGVTLGARAADQVVVTEGLEEGDEIARRPEDAS